MNRRVWYWITLCFLCLVVPLMGKAAVPIDQAQEITVTGAAEIGPDQDSVYQSAVYDAFRKAVDKVRLSQSLNPDDIAKNTALKNDLILAQRELGITSYKVLRYWKEQNNFYIELTVSFGMPAVDQPLTRRIPKTSWVYQTQNQIISLNNSSSILALWTTQTIEVIAPDSGKRLQWIKTGLTPHMISGERYLVQDGDNLKLCNFKKFNAYNLLNYSVLFKWRQKIPNMLGFYLSEQAAYCIDRSGLIRAFELEKGKEMWRTPANSQAELDQVTPKHLLVILPPTELWIINENGVKLWVKTFEPGLAGKPVVVGNELFCLFKNGQLNVYNLDTGQMVNNTNIKYKGDPLNISLKVVDQKIFLAYNDRGFKGHLQVFHRFTGSVLWEVSWDGPIADSLVVLPDMVVVGMGNTLEARDPVLGLKIWGETISGQVKQIVWNNEKLFVVAGERLYGYELK